MRCRRAGATTTSSLSILKVCTTQIFCLCVCQSYLLPIGGKDTRSLILSCESYHGRRQGSDRDDARTATTAKQQSNNIRRQLRRTAATDERPRTSNNGSTTGEQRQRRWEDEGGCLCLDRTRQRRIDNSAVALS
jgi:hypothetical protein